LRGLVKGEREQPYQVRMSVRALLQLFLFRRRSGVVAPIFRLRERALILQEQIRGDAGQQNSK